MSKFQEPALIVLRLIVGVIFLYAGYGKIFFWTTPPTEMPAGMIYFMQFLSIVEPLGGAALILGFLTRWAALGLAIIMVGAAFFIRFAMQGGFFTSQAGAGIDYVTLIFAGCFALMAYGGGKWTVDAMMKKS